MTGQALGEQMSSCSIRELITRRSGWADHFAWNPSQLAEPAGYPSGLLLWGTVCSHPMVAPFFTIMHNLKLRRYHGHFALGYSLVHSEFLLPINYILSDLLNLRLISDFFVGGLEEPLRLPHMALHYIITWSPGSPAGHSMLGGGRSGLGLVLEARAAPDWLRAVERGWGLRRTVLGTLTCFLYPAPSGSSCCIQRLRFFIFKEKT